MRMRNDYIDPIYQDISPELRNGPLCHSHPIDLFDLVQAPADFVLRNGETGVDTTSEQRREKAGGLRTGVAKRETRERERVWRRCLVSMWASPVQRYYLGRGSRDSRYKRERSEEGSR